MKKIILFAAIAAFVSCSSDDNNTETNSKLKLKSITNNDGYREFIYGTNGFVSEIKFKTTNGVEYTTLYTYDGNTLTDVTYKENSKTFQQLKYTYNNSYITKAEGKIDEYPFVRLYSYDSSNNIIKEEYSISGDVGQVDTFVYQNGNVINRSINIIDGETYTVSYKYDDKNNPFKNTFPDAFLKVLYEGKNNKVGIDGNVTTHVYNKDGFPTTSDEQGFITTYTYY